VLRGQLVRLDGALLVEHDNSSAVMIPHARQRELPSPGCLTPM